MSRYELNKDLQRQIDEWEKSVIRKQERLITRSAMVVYWGKVSVIVLLFMSVAFTSLVGFLVVSSYLNEGADPPWKLVGIITIATIHILVVTCVAVFCTDRLEEIRDTFDARLSQARALRDQSRDRSLYL